jgi:hypothetical protein
MNLNLQQGKILFDLALNQIPLTVFQVKSPKTLGSTSFIGKPYF